MKTHHNFDSTEYYQYDATFPSTGSDDGDDDDKDDYAPVGAMATDRDEEFCNGMSMTMSMGGFQSSLFGKQKADCLTYLFKKWMLNTSGKFQGAMVYTFLLAILCEGMAYSQIRVRKLLPKSKYRKALMGILYGLQQCLGWSLMLISMMFSVELFACVIIGIVVGKVIFPLDGGGGGNRTNRTRRGDPHDNNGSSNDGAGRPTDMDRRRTTSGALRSTEATNGENDEERQGLLDTSTNTTTVRRRRG